MVYVFPPHTPFSDWILAKWLALVFAMAKTKPETRTPPVRGRYWFPEWNTVHSFTLCPANGGPWKPHETTTLTHSKQPGQRETMRHYAQMWDVLVCLRTFARCLLIRRSSWNGSRRVLYCAQDTPVFGKPSLRFGLRDNTYMVRLVLRFRRVSAATLTFAL